MLKPHDIVLFQGDSITHAHRMPDEMNDLFRLGGGYVGMTAARLRYSRPNDCINFYNRGVCGNTTDHLLKRWEGDCLDLQPTVLSLLIGVNDSNAHMRDEPGNTLIQFRANVEELLDKTKKRLAHTQLILLEPFLLKATERQHDQIDDIKSRQAIIREAAVSFGALFIPLQHRFDCKAQNTGRSDLWIYDGVHPTAAGHWLISHAWLEATRCLDESR